MSYNRHDLVPESLEVINLESARLNGAYRKILNTLAKDNKLELVENPEKNQ